MEHQFKGLNRKKTAYEKAQAIAKGEDKITVRVNPEERAMLEEAKKILMVDRDSTALKELAGLGFNVIHGHLLGPTITKIVRRIRKGYDKIV